MRVIPVMDLMKSVVVRAVAGQRADYRPVESVLCQTANPLEVAEAFRRQFGWNEIYIADLDAILADTANFETYETLRQAGFRLLVDCGLTEPSTAETALAAGADKVIVGLETWPLLASLELLVRRIGPERICFSLDLRNGEALRGFRDMISAEPIDIATAVLEAGVHELIVLDLKSVGTGSGPSTLPLCRQIRAFSETCSLITGGGIRGVDDLKILQGEGLQGVLVATALHSGAICSKQLAEAGFLTSR